MENYVGFNSAIAINWALYYSNDAPFSLIREKDDVDIDTRIYLYGGKGRSEIQRYEIIGENQNIIAFRIDTLPLQYLGGFSLRLEIYAHNKLISTQVIRNAFKVISSNVRQGDSQTLTFESYINVTGNGCDNLKLLSKTEINEILKTL